MHQVEEEHTGIPKSRFLNVPLTGDFSTLQFLGIKAPFTLLNLHNVNFTFISKQTSMTFILCKCQRM